MFTLVTLSHTRHGYFSFVMFLNFLVDFEV